MSYYVIFPCVHCPEDLGKDLWFQLDTGQTQYSSPPTAYWGEASDPANAVVRPEVVVFEPPVDQPTQAWDSLTKTVPKTRNIPNRVVMNTSGAQYDRWKQATCKELQAFLNLLAVHKSWPKQDK